LKTKLFSLILILFTCSKVFAQITAVDPKGTKVFVDSSKWKITDNNISNKNTGNTGIGVSSPLYKLDVSAASNPLRLMGLQTGNAITDSLVSVQNGVVKKLAPISTFIINRNDSTTASNGLNLNGKDVRLGGNLTQPTTITNNANPLTIATGGTALNITGLTNGTATTDSLMVVQNGAVKKLAPISTFIINRNDSTTASNGLNLNGKDVRLGGNLTQPTTITNNANPLTIATGGTALNITGLTNGTATTDSLMVVQNGAVKKLAPISTFIINKNDSTTASNGLNLNGKDVRLGGNLTQPTTITNNANPLTIATGGTALNITGLPSGNITDSIVTLNNATGQLRKLPFAALQPKLAEIFDAAGTQALTTTFANLNLGTTNIVDNGFTAAGGIITVATAGVYKITMRATVRVTTNTSSGGEFRITAGGVALPGTLGYTYQHNANRPYGTVTIIKVTSLDVNTVVAAQGRRYSANGNLVLAPDGSSLLIEKIR
jgi:hypothetical protein